MKKHFSLLAVITALSACSADKDSTSIFLAKELCSCRYLVGQSEDNCREAVRFALAAGDATFDDRKKEVTATAEDKSHPATFRFVSVKYGCELK